MLSRDERAMLFELAGRTRGLGQIVDAGCCLGGSTVALASGVKAHGRTTPAIHSYDLFLLDEWTKQRHPDVLGDVAVGTSFRPRFESVIAPYRDLVEVHEGDIRDAVWSGGPIELLFLDVCKSPAINDHVVKQFFPALLPKTSIVVQQDFVHEWLPHIHITMGLLADAFEFVDFAPPETAVFRVTRPIDLAELDHRPRAELSPDEQLAAFDRACLPFKNDEKAVLDCARAVLLADLGRHEEALAQVDRISPETTSTRVPMSVAETRSWVLRTHPDPAVSGPAWQAFNESRAG